jgi:hypothetical protein
MYVITACNPFDSVYPDAVLSVNIISVTINTTISAKINVNNARYI